VHLDLVRMAESALQLRLDLSANVQMGFLGQSVATMETVAVLSTLATMEVHVWRTGPGTGVSVSRALPDGTARLTTGMSACMTHVGRMVAVLTSLETMIVTARSSLRGRIVISMMSHRLEVLTSPRPLDTLASTWCSTMRKSRGTAG